MSRPSSGPGKPLPQPDRCPRRQPPTSASSQPRDEQGGVVGQQPLHRVVHRGQWLGALQKEQPGADLAPFFPRIPRIADWLRPPGEVDLHRATIPIPSQYPGGVVPGPHRCWLRQRPTIQRKPSKSWCAAGRGDRPLTHDATMSSWAAAAFIAGVQPGDLAGGIGATGLGDAEKLMVAGSLSALDDHGPRRLSARGPLARAYEPGATLIQPATQQLMG
jgi:hypothetical protein